MKFTNTEVWGFRHAIRGMRNPMKSWEHSDSYVNEDGEWVIGADDQRLMKLLIKAGASDRKFLRQIFVSVDIEASLYWWKEFDTYKVGTVANSESTMHKLATTPITFGCFETDDMYNIDITDNIKIANWVSINIKMLERLREKYLETKDKKYWKELIRWLPESWLQKRTVTMSYENIRNMIAQRKNHKLNEWSGKDDANLTNFIKWAHTLPYADILLFDENPGSMEVKDLGTSSH